MPKKILAAAQGATIRANTAGVVTIHAADTEGTKGPRNFDVLAYTGGILPGALNINGKREDVIIDLAGLRQAKSLVANLDHDPQKRVGNVTGVDNDKKQLTLSGTASAATAARDEVINSAAEGFVWQASVEANPIKLEEIKAGKSVTVNGQTFHVTRTTFVAREARLDGFGFVSHGADDNTVVNIAASAGNQKELNMDPVIIAWAAKMGIADAGSLSAEQQAAIVANYNGVNAKPVVTAPVVPSTFEEIMAAKRAEDDRQAGINNIVLSVLATAPAHHVPAIEALGRSALAGKMTVKDFELEMLRAQQPQAKNFNINVGTGREITNDIIEAAICQTGRLKGIEGSFDSRTLEAADRQFRRGITLKEVFILGAQANGYHGRVGGQITLDVQRAAFGLAGPQIHAGFSTVAIPNVIANTANKFLREGWMSVDQTPLRIAAIRSVNDFKTITTVSLTGDMQFEKLGAGGEIKHGTVGDMTYTNKADTYAKMLAITRTDIINDDLGALTSVPRRLGRGGMLKLNDIFWTAFLDNSAFFTSGRVNVNTAVADMTIGGLAATETIFMDQTDPDGKPLGVMPAILLVPTPLKPAANTLMTSERLIDGTATGAQGDGNIWRGRFKVESSPYMSNSSYTGYSAAAWYMLADPNEMPVIEIVALNGRVEPTVETADADFNVLGVQMRGYSDVGVSLQEYRGGVRADGGSS